MRGLQIALFVIGVVILGTQTFRHVYVKWIEPRLSVLDDFRDIAEEQVETSEHLDALTAKYKAALERRKEYEAANPVTDRNVRRYATDSIYQEERALKAAILRVERQQKSIFDLWFYWLCGLASICIGLVAYRRINRWLGMAGVITGFSEMAFWTSPLLRQGGPQGEFDRLLMYKLILSVVSLALLVALWLRTDRKRASD